MPHYTTFDEAVEDNDFWMLDLRDLKCKIASGHEADGQDGRPGLTLVVGCPLPATVRDWVALLKDKLSCRLTECGVTEPKWRPDMSALHMTVYGLIRPEDYQRALRDSVIVSKDFGQTLQECLPFSLTLKGFGILGRGAIAVRISDSQQSSHLRNYVSSIPGVSPRGYVEKSDLNQMVIGRLQPCLKDDQHRMIIKELYHEFKSIEPAECMVDTLSLIWYKREFLDDVSVRLAIIPT